MTPSLYRRLLNAQLPPNPHTPLPTQLMERNHGLFIGSGWLCIGYLDRGCGERKRERDILTDKDHMCMSQHLGPVQSKRETTGYIIAVGRSLIANEQTSGRVAVARAATSKSSLGGHVWLSAR
jgi:hypothetical protein